MARPHDTMMNPADRGAPRPGRLEVHAGHAGGQAGPADQLATSTSSARASARSCRRRSPRSPASRCRSPSRRSPPTRSSAGRRRPRTTRATRRGRAARPTPSRPGAEHRQTACRCSPGKPHRPRRLRRHRRLQGGRGVPPPRRRRRARRARCSPRARTRFVGATTFSALGVRAGAARRCGTTPTRSRTRASARRPTSSSSRPRRPASSARTPPASPTTCSPPRCSPRARRCVVCPAMHTEMWEHPAVQDNLRDAARAAACTSSTPEAGRLAGGDVGAGRLAEPGDDRRRASSACSPPQDLAGLRVLVTAGGTREPIDPVRFIAQPLVGQAGPRARRGGRAPAAPRSRSSPPSTGRCPPGVEVVRGRDRGRDGAGRARPRRRRRRRRDGRRRRRLPARRPPPTARSRRPTASPEIVLEPTPDILAALGAAQAPGPDARRASRPRPTTSRANAGGKLAPQGRST